MLATLSNAWCVACSVARNCGLEVVAWSCVEAESAALAVKVRTEYSRDVSRREAGKYTVTSSVVHVLVPSRPQIGAMLEAMLEAKLSRAALSRVLGSSPTIINVERTWYAICVGEAVGDAVGCAVGACEGADVMAG